MVRTSLSHHASPPIILRSHRRVLLNNCGYRVVVAPRHSLGSSCVDDAFTAVSISKAMVLGAHVVFDIDVKNANFDKPYSDWKGTCSPFRCITSDVRYFRYSKIWDDCQILDSPHSIGKECAHHFVVLQSHSPSLLSSVKEDPLTSSPN